MRTAGILALIGLGGAAAFGTGGALPTGSKIHTSSGSARHMRVNYDYGEIHDRRAALGSGLIFAGAIATCFVENAHALDMDAFMNAELDSDVKN